jgi:hypothetical protein
MKSLQFFSICLASALTVGGVLADEKPVIGIQLVGVTKGVTDTVSRRGQDAVLSLQRTADSMGEQLIDRMHNTRKFTVVSRSDLQTILKEQDLQRVFSSPDDANVAQAFKIAGCKYALIVTIDDFQDVQEELRFEGQQTVAHKRTVRLSAVGKIYDTTTGKLLESANFQLEEKDGTKLQQGVSRDGAREDHLLTEMAREMAHRIANRTSDVVFPAKIIAKTGNLVTINRGDGTSIQNGQIWTVFAVGAELTDPDTGESLGVEEIPIGKVKIIAVDPKFSKAQVIEDLGVEKLQILRLDEIGGGVQ